MEGLSERIGKNKGAYVIVSSVSEDKFIRVGKLGKLFFRAGFYAYAGSALGPGGLAARIAHHLKISPKPHWHMDYFGMHAQMKQVWLYYGKDCSEHDLANSLGRSENFRASMKGFGCSDCKCDSHMYRFGEIPDFESFEKCLNKVAPGVCGLKIILSD